LTDSGRGVFFHRHSAQQYGTTDFCKSLNTELHPHNHTVTPLEWPYRFPLACASLAKPLSFLPAHFLFVLKCPVPNREECHRHSSPPSNAKSRTLRV